MNAYFLLPCLRGGGVLFRSNKDFYYLPLQGASVVGRFLLVGPLLSHQHHPLPPALLSHHPSYHHLHHGQVQCYQASGISKCEWWTLACFISLCIFFKEAGWPFLGFKLQRVFLTQPPPLLLWLSESHHHPILSHPSAVVFLRLASYHRLLFCLLWSTLDPVWVVSELSCEDSDVEDSFPSF